MPRPARFLKTAKPDTLASVFRLPIAVALAAAALLPACGGGGDTTIIKKTVGSGETTEAGGSSQSGLSAPGDETSPRPGEQDCGLIPGYLPESVLHAYGSGANCDVIVNLAKAARDGTGIPSSYDCATTWLYCEDKVADVTIRAVPPTCDEDPGAGTDPNRGC
jgi:hypothetical protein